MNRVQYEEAFASCLVSFENTMREMPNPPAEYAACGDGYYFRRKAYLPFSHIGTWMTSFYTGEGLLAYHKTRDHRYLDWAAGFLPAYESKLNDTPMDTMHDLGFLYTLYAVGLYRETGEKRYASLAVKAADELVKRLNLDYGMIRAWGRCDVWDHHSAGLAIIDCMMNLALLFFAWKETGNPFYRQAAVMHADHTLKTFIRPDGSVCHGYQFMEAGGVAAGEVNHCGYGVGSFWARGLTWAIYGYAIAARYTNDPKYRKTSVTLAYRFLEETGKDGDGVIPPWDFRLPEGMEKKRDSSAAAIAACAFDELYRQTGDETLRAAGETILERLSGPDYRNPDSESSGLLLHSNGLEHCTSFGDYFYMEALMRYMDGMEAYW